MIQQVEFTLRPRTRGFHLVTDEIVRHLPVLPAAGLVHLFVKHTSCGLSICENADPDVRTDLTSIFDRLSGNASPITSMSWRATTTCLHTPSPSSSAQG